uniref:glycogenin glucosyltransferase n=1 Tax=Acrobeloides nanus TaxID=290746 RepID=A0A914DZ08_9BILA
MGAISSTPQKPCSFVTWVNNDNYALGALVLGHSLRKVETKHKLHLMYSKGVSTRMLELLKMVWDEVSSCDIIDSKDENNLKLIQRPELGITFTKLHCWRLTQYSKCAFIDSDAVVVQNVDDMMNYNEIAAAADMGWPDFFNSGVYVFEPSEETYRKLLEFALEHGTFDGGDQGLLNMFFKEWHLEGADHRLSFCYNVCPSAAYGYKAALKKIGTDIKIVHFMGHHKPWHCNKGVTPMPCFWSLWQSIYHEKVREHIPAELYPGPSDEEYETVLKRGLPDFKQPGSYDNIKDIIRENLHQPS